MDERSNPDLTGKHHKDDRPNTDRRYTFTTHKYSRRYSKSVRDRKEVVVTRKSGFVSLAPFLSRTDLYDWEPILWFSPSGPNTVLPSPLPNVPVPVGTENTYRTTARELVFSHFSAYLRWSWRGPRGIMSMKRVRQTYVCVGRQVFHRRFRSSESQRERNYESGNQADQRTLWQNGTSEKQKLCPYNPVCLYSTNLNF